MGIGALDPRSEGQQLRHGVSHSYIMALVSLQVWLRCTKSVRWAGDWLERGTKDHKARERGREKEKEQEVERGESWGWGWGGH